MQAQLRGTHAQSVLYPHFACSLRRCTTARGGKGFQGERTRDKLPMLGQLGSDQPHLLSGDARPDTAGEQQDVSIVCACCRGCTAGTRVQMSPCATSASHTSRMVTYTVSALLRLSTMSCCNRSTTALLAAVTGADLLPSWPLLRAVLA